MSADPPVRPRILLISSDETHVGLARTVFGEEFEFNWYVIATVWDLNMLRDELSEIPSDLVVVDLCYDLDSNPLVRLDEDIAVHILGPMRRAFVRWTDPYGGAKEAGLGELASGGSREEPRLLVEFVRATLLRSGLSAPVS